MTIDKNQYSAITGPSSPPQGTWAYDADGNLIDDGTRLFTWDAWNRLREVRLKDGGTLLGSYSYDALGRRISKTVGSTTTLFVYDGWNVIQEYEGSALHAYLVWGEDLSGSLQGAGGVGGLLARVATDGVAYFHYDANGNPARLATANGGWWGCYRYDAFGNVREQAGDLAANNPWQFSTKYRDAETGFSYYGYRYYDPVTGRWPSRDPIGERGGVNLYGFVENGGVSKWDYLGLKIEKYNKKSPISYTLSNPLPGHDGATDADWDNLTKSPIARGKGCWFLEPKGSLEVKIEVLKGATTQDNFGNTPEQHERGHEKINAYWYNLWADNANPLEGYYCSKKCADLAKDFVAEAFTYSFWSSIQENVQGDINAYGNKLTAVELQQFQAAVNKAREGARNAWERAQKTARELNKAGCKRKKNCPS